MNVWHSFLVYSWVYVKPHPPNNKSAITLLSPSIYLSLANTGVEPIPVAFWTGHQSVGGPTQKDRKQADSTEMVDSNLGPSHCEAKVQKLHHHAARVTADYHLIKQMDTLHFCAGSWQSTFKIVLVNETCSMKYGLIRKALHKNSLCSVGLCYEL